MAEWTPYRRASYEQVATTPRLPGLSADHNREPAPLRMVALLDRRVEGVEVDVHDEAGHGADGDSAGLSGQARSDCRSLPTSDPTGRRSPHTKLVRS